MSTTTYITIKSQSSPGRPGLFHRLAHSSWGVSGGRLVFAHRVNVEVEKVAITKRTQEVANPLKAGKQDATRDNLPAKFFLTEGRQRWQGEEQQLLGPAANCDHGA